MAREAAWTRGIPTRLLAVASGILAERMGCTETYAIRWMTERAVASGMTVGDIAAGVVERQNRFAAGRQ